MVIKCTSDPDHCGVLVDQTRLYLAVIGLILNLCFIYFHLFHQQLMFPHVNIPWAKTQTSYRYFEQVSFLGNVIFLALVNLQQQNKDKNDIILNIGSDSGLTLEFYIVLLPLFAFQSIMIYLQSTGLVVYDCAVSNVKRLRDTAVWSMLFTAIIADISDIQTDISYIFMTIVIFLILQKLVQFLQQKQIKKVISNTSKFLHHDNKTLEFLDYLIVLASKDVDGVEYNLLRSTLYKHQYSCQDKDTCPALTSIVKNNATPLLQTVNIQQTQGDTMKYQQENEFQFDNENDINQGLSSHFIVKTLFDTVFYHAKTEQCSVKISLFEIFIKLFYYNQIISSYYRLTLIKKRLTSRIDKQNYNYLQNLIINSYKCVEKQHENCDVEKVMAIEQEFIRYKQCILDATLQVQKFWQGLSNVNSNLLDLMSIGTQIVDTYVKQKECYEHLLQLKPDFSEIILYYVQFCQNVMNFEIEAIEANNFYKKIIEKQKVVHRNFYNITKKDFSLIIVGNQNQKINQVILVNQIFEEITGILATQIIGRNINHLIPKIIAEKHDLIMKSYLNSYDGLPKGRLFERVWLKLFDDTIIPITINIITCLSQNHGLLLVGFAEINFSILIQNIQYKTSQPLFLIADETGIITNTSPQFLRKYFPYQDSMISDYKLNIKDLFPMIDDFTCTQLTNGVKTKLNKMFYRCQHFASSLHSIEKDLVDVKLILNKYSYKQGINLQEIVFIEEMTTLNKSINNSSQQLKVNADLDYQLTEYAGDNIDAANIKGFENHGFNQNEPYSSASGSSESSNTENQKGLLSIKNMLDFNKVPQALVNLKRAIILFFMVMIATALAMLTTTLVSHHEFHVDQETTKNCIFINRELANMRLSFRMLSYIAQRGNYSVYLTYEDQIQHLKEFFAQLQQFQNKLIDDDHPNNQQIKTLMTTNALKLQELQSDGTIKVSYTTYFSGVQQFLSKVSFFLESTEEQLVQIYKGFSLSANLNKMTDEQRDAWFVIVNSNENIRDFTIEIMDLYLESGMGQEKGYRETLLIIMCICVGVTILSTIILSPTASNLDNEELNVIHKWNEISDQVKLDVLLNIDKFYNWMLKVDQDRTKIHDITNQLPVYGTNIQINNRDIIQGKYNYSKDLDNFDLSNYSQDNIQKERITLNAQKYNKSQNYIDQDSNGVSMIYQSPRLQENTVQELPSTRRQFMQKSERALDGNQKLSYYSTKLDNIQLGIQQQSSHELPPSVLKDQKPLTKYNSEEVSFVFNSSNIEKEFLKVKSNPKHNDNKNNDSMDQSSSYIVDGYNNKVNDETYIINQHQQSMDISYQSYDLQNNSYQSFVKHKKIIEDERDQFENNSVEGNALKNKYKMKKYNKNSKQQSFHHKKKNDKTLKWQEDSQQKDMSSQINDKKQSQSQQQSSQKTKKQFDSKNIRKIFRFIKLKRLALFAVINVVIICFFIGQYFITDQVIREASDSFMMQYVFSERIACLTTSLNLVLETFADNSTQHLGHENKTIMNFMLENCGEIENTLLEYTRNSPPQMVHMIDQLRVYNSDQACYLIFGDDPEELDICHSKINRIMDGGLRTAIQQIYHHSVNEMIYFKGLAGNLKTEKLLKDKIYKSTTQLYMDLIFDVIIPITYKLGEMLDESIDVYLDEVLDKYFTLFGIFLGFLLITLIIIFKYALIALRNIVLRTRVLIKIIPIEELKKIIDRRKNKNLYNLRREIK